MAEIATAISDEGRVRSMINWYDRIGNRIEMKIYEDSDRPDFEWVKGNVIEGYRYRDGIVSMKSDDGRMIWCGVESGDFRKSEDSLGDFISNADRIRSMSDEELAVSRVDRIDFYTKSDIPEYIGDFAGIANSIEEAIALEIKWLQQEVEE